MGKLPERACQRRQELWLIKSLKASSLIAMALASYAVTLGLGQHTAAVIAAHGYERYVLTAKWQIIAFRM